MMETVLNLGSQRRHRRGPGGPDPERAVRVGLLSPVHHDVRQRGARHQARGVRRAARRREGLGSASRAIPRCRPRSCASSPRPSRTSCSERTGSPFPQDPQRAAPAGDQRRVRLLVREEGGGVPAHPRHSRRLGHGGDRDGHGLRQPRRDLGNRRGLHARSRGRASGASTPSSCRTPRARTWWRDIRTPLPIEALHQRMPAIYDQLLEIAGRLERHYKDMQDIEFTVQEGTLYLLQTRSGKRSAAAAVRVGRGSRGRERDRPAHGAPAGEAAEPGRAAASRLRRAGQGAAPWTPSGCWREGCRPHRGPRWARWCSTPIGRWSGPRPDAGSSSFVPRPRQRTWRGCTRPRASSPPAAGAPPTRPWSPWDGQVLRGRGRGRGGGHGAPRVRRRRPDRPRGRRDLGRRQHRRGHSRRRQDDRAGDPERVPDVPEPGPTAYREPGRAGQRRHARRTPARRGSSAPRASGSSGPSTCSSRPSASPSCGR